MRKKGGIWSHVSAVEGSPGRPESVRCLYCGEEVSPRAARIEAHLARCPQAPSLQLGARNKPSPVQTSDEAEVKVSGRPKGGAWREFTPAVSHKTTVTCLHCGEEVSARAARVSAHIARCQPERSDPPYNHGREENIHKHKSYDPLSRLLEFVIRSVEDLLNCQSFLMLDGEIKQRLRHLFFITELGHRGNKKHIAGLLEEHEAVLEDINNGSVMWTSEHYFAALEERVLQKYQVETVKEDLSDSIKKIEEDEGDETSFVKFEQEEEVEQEEQLDFFQLDSDLFPEPDINMLGNEKLEDISEKKEASLEEKSLILKSPSSVGRPKGGSWSEFSSLEENKTTVQCKHCGEEVSARLARINVHLEKCAAVDVSIKLLVRGEENKKATKADNKNKKLKKRDNARTEGNMKCDACEFVTKFERRFEKHCFENHEQTMCSDCGLTFTDFSLYRKHTLSHREPRQCPHCPQKFLTDQSLRNHVRNNHDLSSPRKVREKEMCPTCGKCVQSIKVHMMAVHQALVPCPYCGKTVKKLKSHIENTQCNLPEDQRTIELAQCPYCSKQIKKSKLKAHIRILHEEKDKYQCGQCGYKTGHKFNLDQHVKKHEGKPLKEICPQCNKECVSLAWHIKTYHTSIIS